MIRRKITIIKNRPRQTLWLPGLVNVHLGIHQSGWLRNPDRPQEVNTYPKIDVVAIGFCEAKNHRGIVPEGVDGQVTIIHYYEADQ